jgi:rubrerythrin
MSGGETDWDEKYERFLERRRRRLRNEWRSERVDDSALWDVVRCEECGGRHFEGGEHTCERDEAFSGECPMCGELYQSYTTHMTECPGPDG